MLQQKLSRQEREVATLNRIIDTIRPELSALSKEIATAESFRFGDDSSYQTKYMEGIYLVYNYQITTKQTDNNRGERIGHGLVLTPDGHLVHLERYGHWSKWAEETSSWETCQYPMTLTAAIGRYSFHQLIFQIICAIEDKIKKKVPHRTKKLKQCLKQVQQIAAET